jgi:DHA2 family multidrug resistance protein
MSATSIAVQSGRQPVPAALIAAFPSEVTLRQLLGILGVLLGAGTVTLTGRLLTLGLADLKGNVGIGFDDGAWISSAYNVALMFIGPFTVYLGGLLGPRRVLLAAAAVFTVVCAFLPLIHSYSLLLVALVIAGLSSGTFYPLTLTFALRNVPLRYLAYLISLYVVSIEGAVNFAPSLYGFFRNHISFEWMFWIPAVITPVMMACIYVGISPAPKPKTKKQPPSFAGFLYFSAGCALLFAALDQGQRLDWWRSGVFTALFTSGIFFMLCAAVRRLRSPNFLVDLPYIRKWNTILLGGALFSFRFVLLATVIIIPASLTVRGLDAEQFAPAVLWTAVLEIVMAVVAAFFLSKGLDSRLLMALGFAAVAFACLVNADFTSVWAPENYFRSELLMAVGQTFAMLGLVSSIILQVAFSGGLDAPQRVLTFSAFFHSVRLLGGQAGVVAMGHFIAEREKVHSFLLGLHAQAGDWVTDGTLRGLAAGLSAKSSGAAAATGRALGILDSKLRLQAYALTYIDAFHLVAWACVAMMLASALLRKSPVGFGQLSSVPGRPR